MREKDGREEGKRCERKVGKGRRKENEGDKVGREMNKGKENEKVI